MQTIIIGTGSFIPDTIKTNADFLVEHFFDEKQKRMVQENTSIVAKFHQITGIAERRYADCGVSASHMAVFAAEKAIRDAGIDPNTLDQIIVAHNFGDIAFNTPQSDMVPSLAARVKNKLGIKNPSCVAYDLLFGCPGWLQGLIQADAFGKAGLAKRCLVIGTEALSRVIDRFDRDSMIFSDGAGAVVTSYEDSVDNKGILGSQAASYAGEDLGYINMGTSNSGNTGNSTTYLKMQGRKVYEFALKEVPVAIKACLDKCNIHISQVKKIFIHQANEKMDEAIVQRLYKLYDEPEVPLDIMPMNIQTLGNSSVATIPTLFDMVRNGKVPGYSVQKNDIIIFASVGAGMNINAVCYRV